jgi:hypothetical protein
LIIIACVRELKTFSLWEILKGFAIIGLCHEKPGFKILKIAVSDLSTEGIGPASVNDTTVYL